MIEFFVAAGWTFLEGFGMTELSPAALFLDAADVVAHAGSVGRPFMHVDARLVDPDDHPVPAGDGRRAGAPRPDGVRRLLGTARRDRRGDPRRLVPHRRPRVADADGFVTLVDRIRT